MRKFVAGVALVAVSVFGITGVGVTATAGAAPTKKPPKACLQALDYAETLDAASREVFTTVGDFLTGIQTALTTGTAIGISTGIATAATEADGKLTPLKDEVLAARAGFEVAAAKCRAGR